ncbi:uncharacterized protein LOC128093383 [Culex pipiens pallens]|uniref:uncharacterized protein LOC128093383 n=1 Tax=Culex pipiens pallens TaxID=42434 RepID=UPI0022AA8AB3|nr:uncharacterized protein LOC128093383 [Culex pipiens pallens]
MSKYRRNAVVLDFNVMPVRPDIETVSKFIAKGLTLDLKRTKNLQFNNSRNHVIIELGSPEEASELADQHNLKHNLRWSGRNFAIPIFVEDNAIQVRVHDLPPHMPNDLITSHLEAYGEVRSIRNEVWRDYFPGIPNGVRAVRMVLSKPIPSFIQVESDLAYGYDYSNNNSNNNNITTTSTTTTSTNTISDNRRNRNSTRKNTT